MTPDCAAARVGAALAIAASLLCGCGQSLPTPPLSDIISLPGGVLTSDQQQRAIQDLSEKKTSHETQVAQQIQKAR